MIKEGIVGIYRIIKSFINLVILGFRELGMSIINAKSLYKNNKRIEKNAFVRKNSHIDINNEIF